MSSPFEKIKIPLSVEETIKKILQGLPRIAASNPKERCLRRIRFVEEQVRRYDAINIILTFTNIKSFKNGTNNKIYT